jgi:hypothetical protein
MREWILTGYPPRFVGQRSPIVAGEAEEAGNGWAGP